MNAPRPAHYKAIIDDKLVYACVVHTEQMKTDAAQPLQPVPSSERDSASVWCNYCGGDK